MLYRPTFSAGPNKVQRWKRAARPESRQADCSEPPTVRPPTPARESSTFGQPKQTARCAVGLPAQSPKRRSVERREGVFVPNWWTSNYLSGMRGSPAPSANQTNLLKKVCRRPMTLQIAFQIALSARKRLTRRARIVPASKRSSCLAALAQSIVIIFSNSIGRLATGPCNEPKMPVG
jgi:hypothetical protein